RSRAGPAFPAVAEDGDPCRERLPRDRPPEVEGQPRDLHAGRRVAPLEHADQEAAVRAALESVGGPGTDRPLRGREAIGLGHEQALLTHRRDPPGWGRVATARTWYRPLRRRGGVRNTARAGRPVGRPPSC